MKLTVTRSTMRRGMIRFEDVMVEHEFDSIEDAQHKADERLPESERVMISKMSESPNHLYDVVCVRRDGVWQ